MANALRIALIADIHHGIDMGTKLGSAALPLMRPFVDWVNANRPDLVVELGDRINDRDKESDIGWTRDVAHAFTKLGRPYVHILGNHDFNQLTRDESEDAMQTTFDSHSRDVRGHHLVFWNSSVAYRDGGFRFAPEDLAWLAADLAATELPTIVFSHLPLDNGSMIGNFYFEKLLPNGGHYADGAAARDIIERSGKVVACFAGHTHWNTRTTIDGVHYITIHSLTESFTTHPHPTGAFGFLSIENTLEVEVFGRDPALYRLPVKPPGFHWQNLYKDFAPKPARLTPKLAAVVAAQAAGRAEVK
ncbi:MAG: metallophosphoesterase [Rhodospirillales bacterium]|nr:metallophosphoesterase [Rhodospirillales bacterium]